MIRRSSWSLHLPRWQRVIQVAGVSSVTYSLFRILIFEDWHAGLNDSEAALEDVITLVSLVSRIADTICAEIL